MKTIFTDSCANLFEHCPGNRINIPELGDVTMYEPPLIGFASAEDELFEQFKAPEAIGPLFWEPKQWLPDAKTVVAFFFPFTDQVRESNRQDPDLPSMQWLYARIEGQQFINRYMEQVAQWLKGQGIGAVVPSSDSRFAVQRVTVDDENGQDFHIESRWSERHAAYVCGVGTFGLSRGLITEKGIAGRFASVIINAAIEPDKRAYSGIYDYCIKCGACGARCPAGAISPGCLKNNSKCSSYVDAMGERYKPRYGCGKCQTGVPCERGIPTRR